MKTNSTLPAILSGLISIAVAVLTIHSTQASIITKATTGTDLTAGASWSGGVVPTNSDVANWSGSSLGSGLTLGSSLSWLGISISGAASDISISGAGTLTLGTSGIDMSTSANNLTESANLMIGPGDQAWNITSGRTLTLSTGTFARTLGATLNLPGSGTVRSSMNGFNATDGTTPSPGILGAWATVGTGAGAAASSSGTTFATTNSGNVVAYTNATALASWANIPSGGSGTVNYDITGNGASNFGNNRSLNTARHLGGALTTTTTGSPTLTMNGLMNAGSGLLTFGGSQKFATGSRNELVINCASADIAIPGVISGQALTKTGPNALTLSGANTYTNTFVNAGSLTLSGSATLGVTNGTLTVNGGALNLGGLTTVTVAAVTISGGAIENGTLTGSSYAVNNAGAVTVSAALAGSSVALTKSGPGTLTLSGANTYSGPTTVQNGTLAIGSGGSLAAGSLVTVNAANGNAYLSGMGTINGDVIISPSGSFLSGINLEDGSTDTLTLAGNLNLTNSAAYFEINNASASSGNDLIVVGGNLTLATGNTIHLQPASADPLDTSADYVLFQGANLPIATAGMPALVWDVNTPANSASFTLQIKGSNLVLTASGPSPLNVYSQPVPTLALTGQGASFTVGVNGGTFPYSYRWYVGAPGSGTPVPPVDANGTHFSGTNTATLSLTSVAFADSGTTYYCAITDSTTPTHLTTNSTAASLTVHTPANLAWLAIPASQSWNANNSDINWTNIGSGAKVAFTNGDNVTFNDSGNLSGNPITIDSNVVPGSVTVNNSSAAYVLEAGSGGGKISSATGLTKTGSGTLTINAPTNDYTGVTTLSGGTLTIQSVSASGNPSPIGAASPNSSNLVFNGGTLKFTGTSGSTDHGATLNSSGGVIDVTAGSSLAMIGVIAGTAGGILTKTDSGTLILGGPNTYNGNTFISGFLQLNAGGTLGNGSGTATINAASALLLGGATTNAGAIVNNGAITNNSAADVTLSGPISGSGPIVTTGSGNLILSGNNSSYSGTVYVQNQTSATGLIVANNNALGTQPKVIVTSTTGGTGVHGTQVTLAGGVTVPAGSGATTLTLPSSGAGSIRSALAGTGFNLTNTWSGPILLTGDGAAGDIINFYLGPTNTLVVSGNISVSSFPGTLLCRGDATGAGFISGNVALNSATGQFQVDDGTTWTISGSANTWATNVLANGGTLKLGANNSAPTGSVLVNSGNLDLAGFNQQLAGLYNTGYITNSGNLDATLTYNSANSSAFTGILKDGAHKLALTIAAGTLSLNGVNTYTGPTTVSGGTLRGNGIIPSKVTVNSTGTVWPGAGGATDTLTILSNLVLNAGSTTIFDLNGSTLAHESITVGHTATYGGMLSINPAGTFSVGQSFTLFSGAGAPSASNFSSIQGSPGSGKAFSFTNGVLSVVSAGPGGPARLTNSVSGSTLSLSWPAGQGWRLQTSPSVTPTAWVYVTDGSISSTNLTIDRTRPTVFYRLAYP